jgi:Holliday junction resolvasome RuvABC endonuclease subunit
MSTLALDPGLNFGWADSSGECGTLDLSKYEDYGEAVARASDWLDRKLSTGAYRLLAIERPFGGMKSPVTCLTEWLVGAAHASAWQYKIPRTERTVTAIRKFLTGDMRAGDKAVMAALAIRGFKVTTPHEADAAALICLVENRQPLMTGRAA